MYICNDQFIVPNNFDTAIENTLINLLNIVSFKD